MTNLISQILETPELDRVEFKKDASSPAGIVKEFGAFANTAGGTIVIGVEDDGTVVGVEDQKVEEAISNAIYAKTVPQLRPDIVFSTHEGKDLVLVRVSYYQGPDPLAVRKGKDELVVYERVGSNSMPVDEKRLDTMRQERQGQSSFDQLPMPPATTDDLDHEAIAREFAEVGIDVDEAKLESFGLAARINDEMVPTRAGLVLFGKDNFREYVPDCYFRAIRYPGERKGGDVIDRAEWRELSLLPAVDEVFDFIRRNTNGIAQRIPGRRHQDIPHYNEEILREVLHNVVAHTDYSEEGMHLNVSIYSIDRDHRQPRPLARQHERRPAAAGRQQGAQPRHLHRYGQARLHRGPRHDVRQGARGRGGGGLPDPRMERARPAGPSHAQAPPRSCRGSGGDAC